jgi:small-conductance mechanosensitive channel
MIPALILVLSAVAYRIAAGLLIHSGSALWLSNFAPMAAIALCGAAYFPPKFKFSVPLSALFVSDLVLNYVYGAPLLQLQMLGHYLALALVGWIGFAIQNRASVKTLLPASVLGSTIFYLVVNTFSWLSDPGYAKDFAGLIQAQTVGLPQYSATPTWMFFRNTVLSDLFFTLLFVACMHFGRKTSRARAGAGLPRVA